MFVSVIIPCTDRVDGLTRTIESILKQDYKMGMEILLIENNSKDKEVIRDTVSKFNDERLKHFYLDKCSNANVARNKGIDESIGDVIAFCDSDDYWKSNHLTQKVGLLNESVFAIYSGNFVDRGNRIKVKASYDIGKECALNFLFGNNRGYAQTSSFVLKREVLNKIRWDESLKRNQDYDFFIRVHDAFGWSFDNEATSTVYWPRNVVRNIDPKSFELFIQKYKDSFNDELYANYYFDRLMDSCMLNTGEFEQFKSKSYMYLYKLSFIKKLAVKNKLFMKIIWLINQNVK